MDLTPKTADELGIDADLLDEASDILQPFEKFVPVKVLDQIKYLPENNSLWRGLQFWGLIDRSVMIDFGRFCLAGTCTHCKGLVQETDMERRDAMLLCQTSARAGTHIKKLPEGFRLKTSYA